MHVTSASNANAVWAILQSAQSSSTTPVTSSTDPVTSSVANTSGDRSALSDAAKLFNSLDSLSKSNPAEFKKITSQIASQLQQAASDANDPAQANALNQLATNFQKASQSGNFSDLFSQSATGATTGSSGAHHHHYHAHLDADAATASTADQSTPDSINAIFANALNQISSDLRSTPAATSAL